jgi:hypothetical protein
VTSDLRSPVFGRRPEAGLCRVDAKDNLLAAYELKTSMTNNVVKKGEDKNTSIMTDW